MRQEQSLQRCCGLHRHQIWPNLQCVNEREGDASPERQVTQRIRGPFLAD